MICKCTTGSSRRYPWISPTFLIDVTQRNVLEVVFSRAEYWKCVSIGFVMPLGHYLYRHRLEQAVVLSSTIEDNISQKTTISKVQFTFVFLFKLETSIFKSY